MNILFIYSALPKGGIETFFVRITKKLVNNGNKVRFLFLSRYGDEDLLTELSQYADVYFLDDFLKFKSFFSKKTLLLKLLIPFNKELYGKVFDGVTHIHAPDFNSLLFTNKLLNKNKKIPISTGLYHINEFNFDGNSRWFFAKRIYKYLSEIPAENVLFFNEVINDFYNKRYNNKFIKSIITPIGIELENSTGVLGKQNNKIVSIGRLASWKTYNYHMIQAVKNLNEKGIKITYHSYGDGEEKDNLEKEVVRNGLENQIKFFPGIPYKNFKKTISSNLLFIGAGTALIEASSVGLPSLIGIENSKEAYSYGFLHQTKGLSYQEIELELPKKSIESYIENLLSLDQTAYEDECKKAKIRAKDFGIEITIKDFLKLVKESKIQSYYFSKWDIIKFSISMFVNKMVRPNTNYSKRL